MRIYLHVGTINGFKWSSFLALLDISNSKATFISDQISATTYKSYTISTCAGLHLYVLAPRISFFLMSEAERSNVTVSPKARHNVLEAWSRWRFCLLTAACVVQVNQFKILEMTSVQ